MEVEMERDKEKGASDPHALSTHSMCISIWTSASKLALHHSFAKV